ncbi:MAG: ABC transporter substrate-binding protein [Pseudomonadaceae bacterium]|jgi:NitT/TauT family transport system substrate-binding protein|nr:ABC transporter substrate-binding protein [Pseudomonadaceae bacterium]
MPRVLLLALCLLLSACSPPPPEPLRVAINPWPGFEYLYLAEQLKLFEAQGVQVKILQFGSAHDSSRAYELGQVDGYCTTPGGALLSREQSARQPQIVHVTDYSSGGDLIVAKAPISHVSQLVGKRVGVEPGSLNSYVLARALRSLDLSIKQLTLVNLGQTEMLEALQGGVIDAAVSYPPFSVPMLKQPHYQEIFTTRSIPGEILDVIAFDAAVLATRKSEVQAMLRALEAAHEYASAHPDEANRVMAARENLPAEEFANILRNDVQVLRAADQAFYLGANGLLMQALQSTQEVLLANDELQQPTDLTALLAP